MAHVGLGFSPCLPCKVHKFVPTLSIVLGNLLGPGRKRKTSCESLSRSVDDLPLTGSGMGIVEFRINWLRHP